MSEATEADTVAVEVREAIAWVKFNRPEKRNSMSPTLNRQMLRVLDDLEFRDDVGVLVLTGAGTAWSAGMDLKIGRASCRERVDVSVVRVGVESEKIYMSE